MITPRISKFFEVTPLYSVLYGRGALRYVGLANSWHQFRLDYVHLTADIDHKDNYFNTHLYLAWLYIVTLHLPTSYVKAGAKVNRQKILRHEEQRIKYFQIILNSNFLLLACLNWKCSKSCQLATSELPIGNFDQNLLYFGWPNLGF